MTSRIAISILSIYCNRVTLQVTRDFQTLSLKLALGSNFLIALRSTKNCCSQGTNWTFFVQFAMGNSVLFLDQLLKIKSGLTIVLSKPFFFFLFEEIFRVQNKGTNSSQIKCSQDKKHELLKQVLEPQKHVQRACLTRDIFHSIQVTKKSKSENW